MHRGLVVYRMSTYRGHLTTQQADSSARAWMGSVSRTLSVAEQKPILHKSDLVYLVSLPAHQMPTDSGNGLTAPPLRFLPTVKNQADSTRIWATNIETVSRRGAWESIEKQRFVQSASWTTLWLADVDPMVTEMISVLNGRIAGIR